MSSILTKAAVALTPEEKEQINKATHYAMGDTLSSIIFPLVDEVLLERDEHKSGARSKCRKAQNSETARAMAEMTLALICARRVIVDELAVRLDSFCVRNDDGSFDESVADECGRALIQECRTALEKIDTALEGCDGTARS